LTRIVDLSIAIHDNHCRWQMERVLRKSYERGDQFQATAATMSFHGFTHMDSPRHFDRNGFTTSDITPDMTIGPACVIDLPDTAPNTPITVADLEKANADLRAGDIALLRSNWEQQRSVEALSFWTDAPWLEADACRWLRAQQIKAIAYDFPQDYCIRDYATGERTPAWEENTSHIELLLHGIIMFEYLCNLAAIRSRRPLFIGLPIKVENSDGAPARVVVIDEEQP
jgi:arylformamidase